MHWRNLLTVWDSMLSREGVFWAEIDIGHFELGVTGSYAIQDGFGLGERKRTEQMVLFDTRCLAHCEGQGELGEA